LKPLRDLVDEWRSLWTQGRTQPRLDLINGLGGACIVDTRTAKGTRRHQASSERLALLRSMHAPTDMKLLTSEQTNIFSSASNEGLVFSERGRAMNLVSGVAAV
jgi:hypothetical protein